MSTVLRVKRHINDEPLDALVIASKRKKIEETEAVGGEEADSIAAVVKFAGTVESQNDNIAKHLTNKLTKDELKQNYKQHVVNITNKSRIERQESSKTNRYTIVNCFRSQGHTEVDEIDGEELTVIDVEDSVSCLAELPIEEEPQYVYDLYYTQAEEKLDVNDVLSIHQPMNQEFVFDNYRDLEDNSDMNLSEDSNSESNCRNDYPESEDSENSTDEDMRCSMARLKFEGELNSSSDEDFINGMDEYDVDNFGYSYARYRAKVKKELETDDECSDYESSPYEDDD